MVHEGAKRPPLFPGFDRSAGQNESRKTWEQPAARGSIHTEATVPRQLLLLPAEQRKGFRPLKNIAAGSSVGVEWFTKERSVRLCSRVLTAARAKTNQEKPGNNQRPEEASTPKRPSQGNRTFFNSIKHLSRSLLRRNFES